MAGNTKTLADENGEYPDWIEVHNPGTNLVSLDGWFLTDSAGDLRKWRLPATNLFGGGFLIVFASNKDRAQAGGPLHTNFKLDAAGEFLALIEPDGVTVASQYAAKFPPQFDDVSYGVGMDITFTTLVATNGRLRALIPSDGSLGSSWTQADFDDAAWLEGNGAAGFDTGVKDPVEDAYSGLILEANPLAYWRFTESSGAATASNEGSLGGAVDGLYLGGPLLAQAGPRPSAFPGFETTNLTIRLNGTSARVQIPHSPGFDFGTGPYAVELWFNSINPLKRGDLLSHKEIGNDFGIYLASQTTNAISVYHNGYLGTGGFVASGRWNHLVVTRTEDGVVNAYLNGTSILTAVDTGSMSIASDLLLGSNHNGSPSAPVNFFTGNLDEVALYDRALSEAEALDHYRTAVSKTVSYVGLVGTDLASRMQGVNSSVYLRLPFVVTDPEAVDRLELRLKYDDGVIVYLNGEEVLSRNAPPQPVWNAAATARHPDFDAAVAEEFDLADLREFLRPGGNVLAIHGLNIDPANPDFLVQAELVATSIGALGSSPRYFRLPTPGDLNGVGTADLGPIITSVKQFPELPVQPSDSEDLLVTARVLPSFQPVTSVTLRYRVMFGATNSAPMLDDGQHGDGAAGDGVFGATIPASSSTNGQMIRFYVQATDAAAHASRWPLFEDPKGSPEYLGTVVTNPAVKSAVPVWYWFARTPAEGHNRTGTRCSVLYNGEFYDNVYARQRGAGTVSEFSQKFEFNKGFLCRINDAIGRVEEVNLNGSGSDPTFLRPPLAYETFRLAGHVACASFNVPLRVNGGADRLGIYIEQVDTRFLARRGFDPEGALYKFIQRGAITPVFSDATDGIEKKTRKTESNADLQALVPGLKLPTAAQRAQFLFDNFNVPQLMNFLAVSSMVQDADDVRKNFYLYRDTNGNREWSIFPWDKDWTFGVEGDGGTWLPHPFFGDLAHAKGDGQANVLWNVIFNDPPTREMYLRRLRTVMDEQLQPPSTPVEQRAFEARVDAWFAPASPFLPTSSSNDVRILKGFFPKRRNDLYFTYNVAGGSDPQRALVPFRQPEGAVVEIGSIEYAPASGKQAEEYIELRNPNDFAMDISGWKLAGGVDYTFSSGVVIRSNNVLYVSPDVTAFRGRAAGPRGGQGLLVQGNYKGQLSARGETVRLLDLNGREVSAKSYPTNPTAAQQSLRITEIMYHPAAPPSGSPYDREAFEYVELKNIGPAALDLTGVRLTDSITFSFSDGAVTALDPGQSVLVVKSRNAFVSRYGAGFHIAGEFQGNLDNRGDKVRLEDGVGEVVLDFSYNNSWYPITDGFGFSLVIVDERASWDSWGLAASWRSSGVLLGSPGQPDPAPPTFSQVVINELLSHTESPLRDAVELHNRGTNDAEVGGWYLTDDFVSPKKYRIAPGTIIPAGGFLVLDEAQFNPTPGIPPSFSFSAQEDEVYLFSADAAGSLTGYVHGFHFGAAESGATFGLHVTSVGQEEFVAQRESTLGRANAGPKVGPMVISEVHYHPPDLAGGVNNDLDEYVELYNLSDSPAFLFDPLHPTNTWQLRRAVEFSFKTNQVLLPKSYVLVVSFDPANAAQLAAFRSRYGLAETVEVLGPFAGQLDNGGESVELYKPDSPVGAVVPYVLVDRVEYGDSEPWPRAADGTGASLQRVESGAYGNDPIHWRAALPSPGRGYPGGAPPVISQGPASRKVVAYTDMTFSLGASGLEPLYFQWQREGKPIPGATQATLHFTNLQPGQAGAYTCVVYNGAGSAESSPALLTILIPATIQLQPASKSVKPGTNVAFSVKAVGAGTLYYQWKFNGLPISDETNANLTVVSAQLANAGDYTVTVTDSIGAATSSPATLVVLVKPVFITQPQDLTVVAGDDALFTVAVEPMHPTLPLSYRWRKGTKTIVDFPKGSLTLVLTNVQSTNAGTYSVTVTNLATGTSGITSSNAILTVLADTDHDHIPDDWETLYGLNLNDPNDAGLDGDGDSMTNWQEYIAGTDPTNPSSYLKVDQVTIGAGGTFIEFSAISNKTYTVQFTDSLSVGRWTGLADVPNQPSNRVERVTDRLPRKAGRFYRLVTPMRPASESSSPVISK